MSLYIPDHIDYDPKLTVIEKYLFGLITGLSKKEGYCYMSNAALGERMGIEADRVSRIVSKLSQMGYVSVVVEKIKKEVSTGNEFGTRRKIFVWQHPEENGDRRKHRTGYGENTVHSNKEIDKEDCKGEKEFFEEPRKVVLFSKATQLNKKSKKQRREDGDLDSAADVATSLIDNLPESEMQSMADRLGVDIAVVGLKKKKYLKWVVDKNVGGQDMKTQVEDFILRDIDKYRKQVKEEPEEKSIWEMLKDQGKV